VCAAVSVQQLLCIALNAGSRVSLPFDDRYRLTFISHNCALTCRFRRPRVLRCESAGARLLGLRVLIPREAWIVMDTLTHAREILDATWRCQGRDLKCGRFSISTGPVLLNTVIQSVQYIISPFTAQCLLSVSQHCISSTAHLTALRGPYTEPLLFPYTACSDWRISWQHAVYIVILETSCY
jgi:hypothetical protein